MLAFSIHLIILCIKIRLCTLAHNSLAKRGLESILKRTEETPFICDNIICFPSLQQQDLVFHPTNLSTVIQAFHPTNLSKVMKHI